MKYNDWDIGEAPDGKRARRHESMPSETSIKQARLLQDEELIAMVEAKNDTDLKYWWSWKIVNGIVRVSTGQRG